MRTKVLMLVATTMAVVGIGVLPSLASAATPEEAATAEAGVQGEPFAVEPFVLSECPGSYICFWTGPTYGQSECRSGENCFSAFHGYETGCHALANIDPQSMYNHTGEHWAHFYTGPFGEIDIAIAPGNTYQFGGRWTKGFCIS